MLDLRAELRQSPGEVKPRNVRWRCPKTTTSRRAVAANIAKFPDALQSEAASSISSGLSVVGKIIGHGPLTIFGHVKGEVRASTVVIAEGAQIEGEVSAEELTIAGSVKGAIHANRVKLNSTAVVEGDIFHRTLVIEGSDASMKSARAIVRWNGT